MVSDLHFTRRQHRGVYEDKSLEWLLGIVNAHKPSNLVICGDSDDAWSVEDWHSLTDRVHTSAIIGNHDNWPLLRAVHNLDNSKVLKKDGEIETIDGLRFGFINFIIALNSKRVKEGIPRKTPEEFWDWANNMKGRIDVLVTHESPYDEQYGGRIHQAVGCMTMREILEKNGYPLALSGHLSGPYTIAHIGKTTSIRVDSSPSEKHYALLEKENSNTVSVHIYHDLERIGSLLASLA